MFGPTQLCESENLNVYLLSFLSLLHRMQGHFLSNLQSDAIKISKVL